MRVADRVVGAELLADKRIIQERITTICKPLLRCSVQ
jgi:hypothetical protein